MPNQGKNIFIWLVVGILLMSLFGLIQNGTEGGYKRLTFSDFLQKVEQGEVKNVVINSGNGKGSIITGNLTDSTAFMTQSPDYPGLIDKLTQKDVIISASNDNGKMDSFWSAIISWFPILLLVGVYVFFMRQMQSGGGKGGALGFGKSRARLLTEKTERITFEDVAGIDEAKDELSELVDFLRDPQKYQRLGGKIPRGCLLVGPPGTGKTLLARAIAGEARVPFFTISGSDFVEMFVGVGASRVRDMFEQGKKNAPCIIFIDEIDAVGRHRGAGLGGGNDEREQTLNQLLVEMDGFEANESVIIIAATNRPDVLDPALLRPGRFDRQITVPNPDINGRAKILTVHLKKVPQGPDVDAKVIARGTPGFSGADLANIVNEAALLAARLGKKVVTMKDLEAAKDKVMMGAERKSMVMSEQEKKMTAYHEGGHALVSLHMTASDPIHKATIIPRGRALGMVMRLPESDKLSYLREKMYADLAVSMGGRVAEEIIFGYEKVSSGASSDIKYATSLARAMVTEWGMSDTIGPLFYGADQQEVFLGYSMGQQGRQPSDHMASAIDGEIKRIVEEAHDKAKEILTSNLDQLHSIASALLEYETLTGEEIKALMRGETIRRADDSPKTSTAGKSSLPSARRKQQGDSSASVETPPAA
ncbi:MAG: ATP-dependent zinc metalloprotease FtsH [Rickettsiales bacterium]|nr:ATP-dependent zinc metalloprotease FtsH [Rickettsiales bacterium]